MEDDMEKELTLRELYYSPKTGYRSAEHLYTLAHDENSDISRHFVKTWLQHQASYSRFKKYNNPRHFRSTFVRNLGEQVQVDLTITDKHAHENKGYRYIFMVIELLSRFAFAIPLKRKDGPTVKTGMQEFLDQFETKFKKPLKLMQFDEGSEFLNKDVKPLLEHHDIVYFSTASKRKASIVERLNRTIKEKILKMFEKSKSHKWVDFLPDMIHNYNTQVNRSIGLAPNEVNEHNKFTVWGRLYGHILRIDLPRFKVGQHVRVLKFEPKGKALQKFYREKYPKKISKVTGKPITEHAVTARDKPPFSEEIFVIKEVLLGDPVVYKLYSEEAKVDILGKFYQDELSLVQP